MLQNDIFGGSAVGELANLVLVAPPDAVAKVRVNLTAQFDEMAGVDFDRRRVFWREFDQFKRQNLIDDDQKCEE